MMGIADTYLFLSAVLYLETYQKILMKERMKGEKVD